MFPLKPWFTSRWYFCDPEATVIHSLSQPLWSRTKRGQIAPLVNPVFTRHEKNVIFACKKAQEILPAEQKKPHSHTPAVEMHMDKPSGV